MRMRWMVREVELRGGGRLEKEGEYENEEKERGMAESAWANPGVEGGLSSKYVGCK